MPRCVGLRLLAALVSFTGLTGSGSAVRADVRGDVVVLRGEIVRDTLLKRKRVYVLQGLVTVRAGASLTVRPGVTVYGDQGSVLVVERGARLKALGTAERPVVFTSAQPESERRRGDWGGIVVNGRAPVSAPGGVATGEGGTGDYGGYEPDDDSGTLSHVRIEYAGYPDGPETRASGVSLRGVGARTEVEYVEALNGDGDGIAVAGGTVGLRYVASVGNAHGGFRFGQGWTGTAQFLVAQQRGDVASSSYYGILADVSTPKVANATVVGGTTGVRFGTGARGAYGDLVVVGCSDVGVDARADSVASDIARGELVLTSVFSNGNGGGDVSPVVRDALAAHGGTVDTRDPRLLNPFDEAVPDFRPRDESPALERSGHAPAGALLVPVAFAGAFAADMAGLWTAGWTNFETPPRPTYLANASDSAPALARAFLSALAASDVLAIKRLRITKKEFCWYVWPELPASRLPNVTCDFAWSQATLNSLAGLDEMLHDYEGRRLELVSLRFAGATERYGGFTVHGDTRVTVRDEAGEEREVKLFGSMLEIDERFKLFSFVVD